MDYLPSKKIIWVIAAAGLFIGWLFWVPTTKSFSDKNKELAARQIALTESDLDSDHDGLQDWEEALWKTDLKNPDSDGDGTSDGDEIKAGRNPLTAGPDDLLKNSYASLNGAAQAEYEPGQNMTDYLAKELLVNYFALKQQGGDIKTALPQIVLDKVADKPYPNRYALSDFKTSADNSKSALKNYLNGAGKIFNDNLSGIKTLELEVMQRAMTTNNYGLLSGLSAHISAYEKIVVSLKNMTVPSLFAGTHLEMMNSVYNSKQAVAAMKSVENDPFGALAGVAEYIKAGERFTAALNNIQTIAKNNAVSIPQYEPGYMFIKNQ